jgi:5-methylcytosine-specific restriction endonuclease McrA
LLREAYRAGRLSWARAQPLVPLLQREHRVFERDGWRCTFPGCTSYGNLHDHHIAYRSHGGPDDLWNRTTLCVWHHQRGEHARILRCRGKAPGKLRFELGLRAGRAPLARYRSGDVLA